MARTRKSFSEEDKQWICEKWKEGYNAKWICENKESLKDRKPQTIYPVLIKAGLYEKKPADDRRRHKVNDNYFEIIDTEHKAYWLGFLMADGYLSKRDNAIGITLASKDRDMIEKFKEDVESTYPIRDYSYYRQDWGVICEESKMVMASKKMYKDLENKGFCLDKTNHCEFPSEDIVPKELQRHFIRGYFDGDGSLSIAGEKKYHTYNLSILGTVEFIEKLKCILGKENVKTYKRHKDRDGNVVAFSLCGDKQIYDIMTWLYQDCTIYMNRKYQRFLVLAEKYENNK